MRSAKDKDRQRTTQRGESLLRSTIVLTLTLTAHDNTRLTNLANGKDRSINKTTLKPSPHPLILLSIATQVYSLPRMPPFPFGKNYRTDKEKNKRHKENFFVLRSLRTSDSLPYPALSESHSFRRCTDLKRISEWVCLNDNGISCVRAR